MSNGELSNPWDEGGTLASDWSPANAVSLSNFYSDVQSGQSGEIVMLRPPVITAQVEDLHCWAAALESLFFTTVPPEDVPSRFDRLSNIRRVKYDYRNLNNEGEPSGKLLRADETLRTVYPQLDEIRIVYQEIFHISGPQVVAPSNLVDILTSRLQDDNYVILSYGVGGSYWHDWIVYGIKKVGIEYRIMIMDPNEQKIPQLREEKLPTRYIYIGWRNAGKLFDSL